MDTLCSEIKINVMLCYVIISCGYLIFRSRMAILERFMSRSIYIIYFVCSEKTPTFNVSIYDLPNMANPTARTSKLYAKLQNVRHRHAARELPIITARHPNLLINGPTNKPGIYQWIRRTIDFIKAFVQRDDWACFYSHSIKFFLVIYSLTKKHGNNTI